MKRIFVIGESFGLLGLDGSGKSSLLKMLSCHMSITAGEYFFDGLKSTKNIKTVR